MTEHRSVWQVSGGPIDRPFADVFLRHGVALIGPSEDGPWRPGRSAEGEAIFARRFAEEIDAGDLLLLRTAIDTIAAVGIVVGEYSFIEAFDDVSGWDLCHARRVRWYPLPEPYCFGERVFGANPMRISRVNHHAAVQFAYGVFGSGLTHWHDAPLPELPPVEQDLVDLEESLSDVVGLAQDLAMLYRDSERMGDPPSESEMIAHFVVPLLRTLGWPPEHIAVEWRRIDVALFDRLPRSAENCRFVIEAKRLGTGLAGARKQAEEYVDQLGVSRDLVVTDGFRYRVLDHTQNYQPVAYANLARLKESATQVFDRLRCT